MAEEIRADYDQLEQIASRFANQSHAARHTLQQVQRSMGPLEDGGWLGRGADSFFAEMNSEVLPAAHRLHEVLEEASRTVREIVQKMKHAEEEASSRFRN
ncbi:WXG100 family type VII secretion target [Chloroflexales bacterium ZM16-3]|nr:WXG100 family type VII secretion target [Chloroflexales bacterium ZM16-3]